MLSVVDVGTKFMAAFLLYEETSDSYIKALEKMWIRHFGPPKDRFRCSLADLHLVVVEHQALAVPFVVLGLS